MLTFIWIKDDIYNLLDADMCKLPREGWFVHGDCLCNGQYTVKMCKDSQPSDPYLLNGQLV